MSRAGIMSGSGKFSPLQVSGLVSWGSALDPSGTGIRLANDANVTSVFDKSYNNNPATESTNPPKYKTTGSQYVINGRPVFYYDGNNSKLSMANKSSLNIIDDISLYVVVRPTNFSAMRSLIAKNNSNIANPYDFQIGSGGNAGKPLILMGNGTLFGGKVGTNALTADTAYVLTAIRNTATDDKFYLYTNGSANGTSTETPAVTANSNPIWIGWRQDNASKFLGSYGEWLIYNRAVTSDEHTKICRYLGQQWGITVA